MKKIITTAVIALGLMVSTNAYAFAGYVGSTNLVGQVIPNDQSQHNADVVVSKVYGNTEILNLINRINVEDVVGLLKILERAKIRF